MPVFLHLLACWIVFSFFFAAAVPGYAQAAELDSVLSRRLKGIGLDGKLHRLGQKQGPLPRKRAVVKTEEPTAVSPSTPDDYNANELKGLSKKQRRQLRKHRREEQRAARNQ